MKVLLGLILSVFCFSAGFAADPCVLEKKNVLVYVKPVPWDMEVQQPLRPISIEQSLHGLTTAVMAEGYRLTVDLIPIDDGFCVVLDRVEVVSGFTNFMIQIDSAHPKNSCVYNAIYDHEMLHVKAYHSVMNDLYPQIEETITKVANQIYPKYIPHENDTSKTIDQMEQELRNAPMTVLLRQKIEAEKEIKNKAIDKNPNSDLIKRCENQ